MAFSSRIYASNSSEYSLTTLKIKETTAGECEMVCPSGFGQIAPAALISPNRAVKVGACVNCGVAHILVSLVPVLEQQAEVQIVGPALSAPFTVDTIEDPPGYDSWTHSAEQVEEGLVELSSLFFSDGCPLGAQDMVLGEKVQVLGGKTQLEISICGECDIFDHFSISLKELGQGDDGEVPVTSSRESPSSTSVIVPDRDIPIEIDLNDSSDDLLQPRLVIDMDSAMASHIGVEEAPKPFSSLPESPVVTIVLEDG